MILAIVLILGLTSCSENYSNGTRIGTVNKFSKSGFLWKSWEGHLNITQTGMTSTASDFDFSIDNDNEPDSLVKTLQKALDSGWKVELTYHEVMNRNWLANRGRTNYFVTSCKVIDKGFVNSVRNTESNDSFRIGGMVYYRGHNITKDSLECEYYKRH